MAAQWVGGSRARPGVYIQIKLWTRRQTCSQSTDLVGGHRSLLLVAPVPRCSCFRFLAYRSSQQPIIFHNFFLYSLAWLLVRLCILSSSCSFILFFLISSLSFILNITFLPSLVHPILNGEEFYMQNILSHLTATVQKHSTVSLQLVLFVRFYFFFSLTYPQHSLAKRAGIDHPHQHT